MAESNRPLFYTTKFASLWNFSRLTTLASGVPAGESCRNSDLLDHFSGRYARSDRWVGLPQLQVEFLEVKPESHLIDAVDLRLHDGRVTVFDLQEAREQLLPLRWEITHHL